MFRTEGKNGIISYNGLPEIERMLSILFNRRSNERKQQKKTKKNLCQVIFLSHQSCEMIVKEKKK